MTATPRAPSSDFDLTIRGGLVVTPDAEINADIGIRDGRIVDIAPSLPPGRVDRDAAGLVVLPGGIDSHCHIEEVSDKGVPGPDSWHTATIAAVHGGTTTVIPFAVQHRGASLRNVARAYQASAAAQSVVDFSYHVIVSDPTTQVLEHDLPELIRSGITSFKVFMTYDALKLDDGQLLDVMALALRERALPMIHAENHDVIRWITRRLLDTGHVAPKYHATSHDPLAEAEATHRAIQLSRVLEVPILIVHVSSDAAAGAIRNARALGVPVFGETCPHYLVLTAEHLDLPGVEGAKFCCSPPPRDGASQEAMWQGLSDGTLQLLSSDHAPFRFDATGKIPAGDQTTFAQVANGLPGLELRLPLLFSEGVCKGRISLREFAQLTATNHARLYGLAPRKGAIVRGADADLALWDPSRKSRISAAALHDVIGYTPYEGFELTGWPVTVIGRGEILVDGGVLHARQGRGQFLPRSTPGPLMLETAPSARAGFLRCLLQGQRP